MSHLHFNFFENIHGIHGQQQVGKREHTENSIEEELPCWKFSVGRKNSAKLLYYSSTRQQVSLPLFSTTRLLYIHRTHLKKYLPENDVLSFRLNSLLAPPFWLHSLFRNLAFCELQGSWALFVPKTGHFFPKVSVHFCSKILKWIVIQLEATWAKFRES